MIDATMTRQKTIRDRASASRTVTGCRTRWPPRMAAAIARLSTAATTRPQPARNPSRPYQTAEARAQELVDLAIGAVDADDPEREAGDRERADRPEDDEADVERGAAHVVRRSREEVEARAQHRRVDSTGGARRAGARAAGVGRGRRARRPGSAARAPRLGHAPRPGQRPGPVEQRAQSADLDVPARQDDRDPLAIPDRHPTGEHRRQRRGAGRLDDLLEPLDAKRMPGQDRRVVEQDDPVEVAPAHRQRPDACERGAQPVGDAVRLDRHDLASLERERHRIRTLGLDAVDADRRPALLDRGRHAGDQSPATDADDHDVEIGQVLDDLEADRTVAGDDGRIVERVHELEALGVADAFQLGQRFADVRRRAGRPGRRSHGRRRPSNGRRRRA